jgi:uncharacterized protein YecE (DUF72 family)
MVANGSIRVGIGGWDYEPWRGTFYPPGLAKARQLEFASRALSAIEINATFYKLQSPELYERWAAAVPDDFVFAIKGSRFCSNRKVLADAGESVARFFSQGLTRLGAKLGPILWQMADSKRFDADDIARFLDLLPRQHDGMTIRHVIEGRHESFADPRFVDIARNGGIAICFDDKPGIPAIADASADFVYARLMGMSEEEPEGYDAATLDRWARLARTWAAGEADDLPKLNDAIAPQPRDVFLFMINGAKVRAPAAAQAVIAQLAGGGFS